MKTKNLATILFLLAVLIGGLVIFLIKEKSRSVLIERSEVVEKQTELVPSQPAKATATGLEQIVQPEKNAPSEMKADQEEIIRVKMIINGQEYPANLKPDSSVYNLMKTLKEQKKIDFKGSNYSGLGFFVEEINGIKNNSAGLSAQAGKNWVYYINGKPAPVGISSYKVKSNDIIEWKYEKKSF